MPYLKDNQARILDIGCATGGLLSVFKEKGYTNLLGIDPSPSCVRAARKIYGIDATTNNISNFKTDEKFDLIILSAVLEHLVDFDSLLVKICSLLKEDGMLFVEVPDVERFSSFVSSPFQQFSTEHINYFSRFSLTNLLSKFCFKEIILQQNQHDVNQITEPGIYYLSKKSQLDSVKFIKDDISEPGLKTYISKCHENDLTLKRLIEEKLSDKKNIIVWGVGTHTQRLVDNGLDRSKILFFVDSNKRYEGKKLYGLEIKQPADIKENAPILISTYGYQNEILYQIKEKLKLNNEIITIY